jgi:hypothetical protein
VADTLAGDSAAARPAAAASRASALRAASRSPAIRLFSLRRDRDLAEPPGFPGGQRGVVFLHHRGLGGLGPGQPPRGGTGGLLRAGDLRVRAARGRQRPLGQLVLRRAQPAQPGRHRGQPPRQPAAVPAAGAVIIIIIIIIVVVVLQPRLAARAVRPGRAGQPRLRLRLDRGLQRGDLRGQLLPVQVGEPGRVPRHRGPVHRGQVPGDRARGGQQRQHLHEQPPDLGPVPPDELRDRPVAGPGPAADHPAAQVIDARVADLARGPDPLEKAVEQQRHHHRRVIRRLPLPVGPVRRGEPGQVQLPGHGDHLPGQVIRRQPGADVGRQQAALIVINGTEPSSHNSIIP